VSLHSFEKIMVDRGVTVDHATLNRWVAKYAFLTTDVARRRKTPTDGFVAKFASAYSYRRE